MSTQLIDHSPDLKKLREEGFFIEIREGLLFVYHIPYVTSSKKIEYGILVSELKLAGDRTAANPPHTAHWKGSPPCKLDGTRIQTIYNSPKNLEIVKGFSVQHYFSNKPPAGYKNYYQKIKKYTDIIVGHAQEIDENVTAKCFKIMDGENKSVLNYINTNSAIPELIKLNSLYKQQKVAIIGLGGTGSYVLDFLAKTEVAEIHLYDDFFLNNNAFRAPGAASLDELVTPMKKVEYLFNIYNRMHNQIKIHDCKITESNLAELSDFDFVFICIDKSEYRKAITNFLVEKVTAFVDTGLGVRRENEKLSGTIRNTSYLAGNTDHLESRLPYGDAKNEEYDKNIQIAELNALNATLAIIKWKKHIGYLEDRLKEQSSTFVISKNNLINEDIKS